MLRKLKISTRLLLLILLMIVLSLFTSLGFYYGINNIKNLFNQLIKTEFTETQKDKIKIGTHTIANTMSLLLQRVDEESEKIRLIRSVIDTVRYEKDSSGYYFAYKGTVNIAHPNHKYHDKDLADLKDENNTYFIKDAFINAQKGGGYNYLIFNKPGMGDQPKIVYAEAIPNTDYWIATGVYLDNIENSQKEIISDVDEIVWTIVKWVSLLVILFIVLIAVPLSLAIRRSIIKPLNSAINTTKEIEKGNLKVDISDKYDDEISFLNNSIAIMLRKLRHVLLNVKKTSNVVALSSSEVSRTLEVMSQGASCQASTNEEVSSTVMEIESKIKDSSEKAMQTKEISISATKNAKESDDVIKNLSVVIEKVIQKIAIIEDIAFQTEILSLNAGIQAAKAKQHGKGFAVIALEVQNLAERSQKAALDINQMSFESIEAVNESKDKISVLIPNINQVSTLMQGISTSSVEQKESITEINRALNEFTNVIQQNVISLEKLAASSDQLANNALYLKSQIDYFKF